MDKVTYLSQLNQRRDTDYFNALDRSMTHPKGSQPLTCTPRPAPPEGFTLWHSWESTVLSPSNNLLKNMHFYAYKKLRSEWRDRLAYPRPSGDPLTAAYLLVVRKSIQILDWDNAYGGLKPLLDCLSMPGDRNPDGLGWIEDDKPTVLIRLDVQQVQVTRRVDVGTELHLYAGGQSLVPPESAVLVSGDDTGSLGPPASPS